MMSCTAYAYFGSSESPLTHPAFSQKPFASEDYFIKVPLHIPAKLFNPGKTLEDLTMLDCGARRLKTRPSRDNRKNLKFCDKRQGFRQFCCQQDIDAKRILLRHDLHTRIRS